MLAQADSEVVVVDYSCPDATADYVDGHFPAARTVRVEGEDGFSNWKARNAGAAVAKGALLLFCDADLVLAADATKKLAKLLTPAKFGFFRNQASQQVGRTGGPMAANQLKGFQVIPRTAFEEVGGYDELLAGYAAGGDTELEERLRFLKLEPVPLDPGLIERVIAHDDKTRMRFHRRPAAETYLVGYLYRWLKIALMGMRKTVDVDLDTKAQLHALARQGTASFLKHRKSTVVKLKVVDEPLSMLQLLGGKPPRFKLTINVEIAKDADPTPRQ